MPRTLSFFLTLMISLLAGVFLPAHANTITCTGSQFLTCDARGNLTSDALWTYTWDAVTQARTENLTFVTADRCCLQYPVSLMQA